MLGWSGSTEVYFIASGYLIADAWEARGGKEGPAPSPLLAELVWEDGL